MPNRRHHGLYLRRHSSKFYMRNIFVALAFFLISCDSEPSKDTALNACEEGSETQKDYNLCVCLVKLADKSEDPHAAKLIFSFFTDFEGVFRKQNLNKDWLGNYAKENGISNMEMRDAMLDLQQAVVSCKIGIDIR